MVIVMLICIINFLKELFWFVINEEKMKYLLKKALAKHIPAEILDRRKVGFPNPIAGWLRADLKDVVSDILLDPKSVSRGYFRKEAIEALIASNVRTSRFTSEIFSLVVLELWHRTFVDYQETASTVPTAYSGPFDLPIAGAVGGAAA